MNLEFSYKVADVADDGTMTIETKYDRISVVIRSMGNEIIYDTSEEASPGEANPLLQQLRDNFAQQGLTAELDWELGEVNSSGTMWIDPRTGLTIDSDTDQTMDATFTLTMGTGAEAAKFDMKMVLEQKIRVELLD